MNIPRLVDNKILAALASPSDTLAVRVVVRRVSNLAPYRLHGKLRQYLAAYDRGLSAHCIDVPLSVWMADFPTSGAYRENSSIAHDLQGNRSQSMAPLVFLIVPFGNGAVLPMAQDTGADAVRVLNALRTLSEALGAPPLMSEAFDLAASGRPAEEIVKGLLETAFSAAEERAGLTPDDRAKPANTATAVAAIDRAAKMREAKAAKKAEKAEALM